MIPLIDPFILFTLADTSIEDVVIIEWNILGTRRLVRWNELAKHGLGYSRHPINPRLSIRLIGSDWLEQSNFRRFRLSNPPSLSIRLSPPYFLPPLDNDLSIRSKPRFNFPFPLAGIRWNIERINSFGTGKIFI